MKLPEAEDISMKNTAHGSGAKGMAFYSYEDTEGLGVLLDARRNSHREAFKETWRFRWLPDAEFSDYRTLRTAVASLTDEQIAAEKSKWPQMIEPPSEGRGGTGNCWLHKDRPATHFGWVQTSWLESDGDSASLCEDCAREAANDPEIITRACAQRVADVAARRLSGLVESEGGEI